MFLGDTILDDDDEIAEYFAYITGYSYDDICQMDELFFKRINARLLAMKFEKRYKIAQQSLLTSIADKKKSGKNSKPFSLEELLEFQGFNKLELLANQRKFESMTTDVELIERKKADKVAENNRKRSIKQRLKERFGIE